MRSSRARGLVRALSAQRQAPVIPAKLSVHAPEWAENAAIMQGHLDELRRRLALHCQGGGAKAAARHKARGKMLARERINALVDPGEPADAGATRPRSL